MTSVSVIIPTYNGESFIDAALDSVFAQSMLPGEVVVVDDCSTDSTPQRVEVAARRAPIPVRMLRLDRNSGSPARPTNVGVAATSGDLVLVLDHDDVLAPQALELHQAALAECPEAGFSFAIAAYLDSPETAVRPQAVFDDISRLGDRRSHCVLLSSADALKLLHRHGNFAYGFPGFMFRRSTWLRCGPIPEHLRIAGDTRTVCAMAAVQPVAFVPQTGYFRREHGGNLGNSLGQMELEHTEVLLESRRQNPHLRADRELRTALQIRLQDISHYLRNEGNYRGALKMSYWGISDLGISAARISEVGIIVAHWTARRLGLLRGAQTVNRLVRGK